MLSGCQVEVSAPGRSLIQRSLIECGEARLGLLPKRNCNWLMLLLSAVSHVRVKYYKAVGRNTKSRQTALRHLLSRLAINRRSTAIEAIRDMPCSKEETRIFANIKIINKQRVYKITSSSILGCYKYTSIVSNTQ